MYKDANAIPRLWLLNHPFILICCLRLLWVMMTRMFLMSMFHVHITVKNTSISRPLIIVRFREIMEKPLFSKIWPRLWSGSQTKRTKTRSSLLIVEVGLIFSSYSEIIWWTKISCVWKKPKHLSWKETRLWAHTSTTILLLWILTHLLPQL